MPRDLAGEAQSVAERLEHEVGHRWGHLLEAQPLERYAQAMRGPSRSYAAVDPALRSWSESVATGPDGHVAIEHYHRAVLARLVAATIDSPEAARLPASVRECLTREHRRILADVVAPKRVPYAHGNDLFAKDLAIASLRLLPCGAEHVDLHSGIPRSLAWADGASQCLSVAMAGLREGGFRPWIESHWDRRLLSDFNAEGYDRFYLRVADLLQSIPGARGLIGSTWWFDPAVAELSPELAFLSQGPLSRGAVRFRVGSNEAATRDALRFAKTRARAHAEGRYAPCVYMIAWGRTSLLAWARSAR